MNKTKIEWCDYTFNPVVGCENKCYYCYARKLHNKRHQAYKEGKLKNQIQYQKPFEEPQFIENRLNEPYKLKKPADIFVGSMAGMFEPGSVEVNWIDKIIAVANDNPRHRFLFLTKNPLGYKGFAFPANCHLGLTMTHPNKEHFEDFVNSTYVTKFLSIEPIMSGGWDKLDFRKIDWIAVGAMTGQYSIKPEKIWVDEIRNNCKKVILKDNIRKYL